MLTAEQARELTLNKDGAIARNVHDLCDVIRKTAEHGGRKIIVGIRDLTYLKETLVRMQDLGYKIELGNAKIYYTIEW